MQIIIFASIILNAGLTMVLASSLKFPVNKLQHKKIDRSLEKRGSLEFSLVNVDDTYYAATIGIGSPQQEMQVLFDTGSADLWVMDSNNPFCSNSNYSKLYNNQTIGQTIDCTNLDTYNAGNSTSLKELIGSRFYINYEDDTFADGVWATEDITINGIEISNLQFGLANYATTPVDGVLGIGFERLEAVKGYTGASNEYYPNFPQALKNEGITDVVAYSLALHDSGSIIFGGIDKAAYAGNLYTFPMVNVYPTVVDKPATLSMTIQGLGAESVNYCMQETFFTTKYPVLLDSGTTLISFPTEIADKMANFVNASYSDTEGIYILDCPADIDDTKFLFDFGDLKITVPLSSFILSPDGGDYCGFGVLRSTNSITLGDSFLSNAYVIFDLDNYQISMAQSSYNVEVDADIIEIPTNGAIPNAIIASVDPWSYNESFSVTDSVFATALVCSQNDTRLTQASLSESLHSTKTLQPTSSPLNQNNISSSPIATTTTNTFVNSTSTSDVVLINKTITEYTCPSALM